MIVDINWQEESWDPAFKNKSNGGIYPKISFVYTRLTERELSVLEMHICVHTINRGNCLYWRCVFICVHTINRGNCIGDSYLFVYTRLTERELSVLIIIYIYHALINALCAHMMHINLNMIFYTHAKLFT